MGELWINEHWHVAPRVGFAYRLDNRTVIRRRLRYFTARIISTI